MKKLAFVFAAVLLFLSNTVFAEKHANAAIKQTNSAIAQGKLGKASDLVEHAGVALIHAKKAVDVAKGLSKIHIYGGVKSLEEAISRGKRGNADSATKAAEEALAQIQAGNK